MSIKARQAGFTIPEVIVSVALLAILIIPIAAISFFFISSMFDRSSEAMLNSEAQSILRSISEDLRESTGVVSSSSITDPSKSGGWSTDLSGGVLVFQSLAYSKSGSLLVDTLTSSPYQNESIYHHANGVLYKRNLAANIGNNATIRTCPPASSSSTCPSDAVLTDNLESLSFNLYAKDNTATSVPSNANSVLVSIVLTKKSLVNPITVEQSIRVTKRSV